VTKKVVGVFVRVFRAPLPVVLSAAGYSSNVECIVDKTRVKVSAEEI
jgi:hypothetical protein